MFSRPICAWLAEGYCQHSPKDATAVCPSDCSFADLPFDKDAILERIKEERKKITRLYFFSKQRKAKEMLDRTIGVYIMYDALEKCFGIPNPIKKEATLSDHEQVVSLLERGL